MVESKAPESGNGLFSEIITEIIFSPLNLTLVAIIAYLVYKIFKSRSQVPDTTPEEEPLPKLKRDFTLEELKQYNGKQPGARILVAVNGKVFDVTKGRRFYGPGGPYSVFGGRDATRALATFSINCFKEGYDDLSDLNTREMESVKEWEFQFREKYDYVGKLLKPGEEPTNELDEEEESSNVEADNDKVKDGSKDGSNDDSGNAQTEKSNEKPKAE